MWQEWHDKSYQKKNIKKVLSFTVKQNLKKQTNQMDFNATNLQKDDSHNSNNNNDIEHATAATKQIALN